MSVRSELDEFVEWISALLAKSEPKPARHTLPRENWRLAAGNLRKASDWFGKACAALPVEGAQHSVFAEFARDLEHQADGLALRARMLSWRAPPRPKKKTRPAERPVPEGTTTELAEEHAEQPEPPQDGTGAVLEKPPSEEGEAAPREEPKTPEEFVREAADSLEWTNRNLFTDIADPDAVSNAFGKELDLLAEMALSLRQQLLAQPTPPAPGGNGGNDG